MRMFFIYKDQMIVGPIGEKDLEKMVATKALSPEAQCREGMHGKWQTVGDYLALSQPQQAENAPAAQPEAPAGNAPQAASSQESVPAQQSPAAVPVGQGVRQRAGGECVIECPACGQKYSLNFSQYAGCCVSCGKCSAEFTIPATLEMPEEAAEKRDTEDLAREIPDGKLLCPHCWKSFDSENLLYVSVHPSLVGDPILGDFVQKRFVPSTFNAGGLPLDECGLPATDAACPRCHLEYPVGMIDNPSLYLSIVGATSSGKSYFLTCLVHKLREVLPNQFNTGFYDLSPKLNETLNNYEKQLFMSLSPGKITALPATQISGDGISDRVLLDNMEIELPKPFIFECNPAPGQKNSSKSSLVFYDNSGEMFIPGRDEWVNQATLHLPHSNGIMFLFDPTNDANMCRSLCDASDPQVSERPRSVDQVLLFNEMISRIRRHSNMGTEEKCSIPLVVVIGKYDTWSKNFSVDLRSTSPVQFSDDTFEGSLDMDTIASVSFETRQLVQKYVPSLVDTAERFFKDVFFIPVSSFGTVARMDPSGFIGIVTEDISPIWIEVPALLLLSQNGFLPQGRRTDNSPATPGLLSKCQGGQIVFRHPVTGAIVRLPANYAGRRIMIGGKPYDMPRMMAAEQRKKADDNPWK